MVTTALGVYVQRPLGPLDSCPPEHLPVIRMVFPCRAAVRRKQGNVYEASGCAWQTVCAAEEFVLTGVLGTLLEEGVCTSYGLESEGGQQGRGAQQADGSTRAPVRPGVGAEGWWVGDLQNCLMAGWTRCEVLDPRGSRWRAKVFC